MVTKLLKWGGFAVLASFVLLVIVRMFVLDAQEKTAEQVAKIHATKLTLDDVMGENLPPDPGAEADKTVQGIDANENGIRDDVELAIFKEYPNSAKTRAVLLQYALAFQMEVIQPMINGGTVGAIANEQDRAFFCSSKLVNEDGGEDAVIIAIEKYGQFVIDLQFNTDKRKKAHKDFYSHLESGSTGESSCDIELSSLSN